MSFWVVLIFTVFSFFLDFDLSVYYYCFPRSIVSGDSSSVQKFFFIIETLSVILTQLRKYTIHLPVYWHDTNYILGICFISYLHLFTAVVQKNRTRYFGVQQNDNFNDSVLHFMCILYKLINSTCTVINYNIVMCRYIVEHIFFNFL